MPIPLNIQILILLQPIRLVIELHHRHNKQKKHQKEILIINRANINNIAYNADQIDEKAAMVNVELADLF